ncbi:hypothetical protein LIER_36195 [Lithospermum erythrorhizon]|uniref:Uncharacterized protein n=1 Tax=Lithospermum erythrorhizon TaxID=34254 RepID=A0AAV3P289_LITER
MRVKYRGGEVEGIEVQGVELHGVGDAFMERNDIIYDNHEDVDLEFAAYMRAENFGEDYEPNEDAEVEEENYETYTEIEGGAVYNDVEEAMDDMGPVLNDIGPLTVAVHLKTQKDVENMVQWVKRVRELRMYVHHPSRKLVKSLLLGEMYVDIRSRWPKESLKELDDKEVRLYNAQNQSARNVMLLEW